MKRQLLFAIVVLILFSLKALSLDDETSNTDKINLRSRSILPGQGIDKELENQLDNSDNKILVLINFNKLPDNLKKKELSELGINFISYIPYNTYLASISKNKVKKAIKNKDIKWIGHLKETDKMSLRLRDRIPRESSIVNGLINADVVFRSDINQYHAKRKISENKGRYLSGPGLLNDYIVLIDLDSIHKLAQFDEIIWIEDITNKEVLFLNAARNVSGVSTVQNFPYGLTGENVNIGIWDAYQIDHLHSDFNGRVTIVESSQFGASDHATMVAGIVSGSGDLSEFRGGTPNQWKGVANRSNLFSYNIFEDNDEPEEVNRSIIERNIKISQNSWGDSSFGEYTAKTAKYDWLITQGSSVKSKRISIVFAVGNEGHLGYYTVDSPSTGKNIISVGAVNSDTLEPYYKTGRGPTNDNRLKPDLVASGCEVGGDHGIKSTNFSEKYGIACGTSLSAPLVTGILGLMMQQYGCGTRNDSLTGAGDLIPSTYKALFIHTATDLNSTGPDFITGYGLVNATKAIDFLNYQYFKQDVVLSQGVYKNYTYRVVNETQTKVTLVWDDLNASLLSNITLINDLDLILIAPNGTRYYPWKLNTSSALPSTLSLPATRAINDPNGADHVNNVEQVVIDNPINGTWTIQVNASTLITNQNFSLVYKKPFEIRMQRGLNLVSLPIIPYDTNISDVLTSLNGYATVAYENLDGTDNDWRAYIFSDWAGSSFQYYNKSDRWAFRGLWINVTKNDAVLTVAGEPVPKKWFNVTLNGPLNYVGYPSFIEINIQDATSEITGLRSVERLDYFDNTYGNKSVWRNYFPSSFGLASEQFNVRPGYGFVINITPNTPIQNWTINPQQSCPALPERNSLSGLADYSGITSEAVPDPFIIYGYATVGRLLNYYDTTAYLTLRVNSNIVTNYSMQELASNKYMLRVPIGAGVSTGESAEISICGKVINEGNITVGGEGETRYFNISINTTNSSSIGGIISECSLGCINNSICGKSLTVSDLSVLHSNGTNKIIGFTINNTGNTSFGDVSWSLDMGDGTIISSAINSSLSSNESVFVYVAHNYALPDSYNVVATANASEVNYSLSLNIGDLLVRNFSVLNISQHKYVFSFDINNQLQTNLTSNWNFDTNDSFLINSSINISLNPFERAFVFVEYNFSNSGSFLVNVTATNNSLVSWQNLSLTVN